MPFAHRCSRNVRLNATLFFGKRVIYTQVPSLLCAWSLVSTLLFFLETSLFSLLFGCLPFPFFMFHFICSNTASSLSGESCRAGRVLGCSSSSTDFCSGHLEWPLAFGLFLVPWLEWQTCYSALNQCSMREMPGTFFFNTSYYDTTFTLHAWFRCILFFNFFF